MLLVFSVIFLKVFDTVDHGILLYKLDHYGIRDCALSWFKSFLDCKTQFVLHIMEVNPTANG